MGGRGGGGFDLDARIVAKRYYPDFNVKQLYYMQDYATNIFPLCRIVTGASYMFCLGRLNNVLHSRFGFGFSLTFLYLPVIYIHISFSQCLNSPTGYSSKVCIRFVFETREPRTEGLQ